MKYKLPLLILGFAVTTASPFAFSQQVDYPSAKDVAERTLAGENTGQQAMEVAILVFDPKGGNPIQRAAHQNFFTGERFKLKIKASKSGTLKVVNIEKGNKQNPLSSIAVAAGVETLYPADANKFLEFDSNSGDEILRLSLDVAAVPGGANSAPASVTPPIACPPACPMPATAPAPAATQPAPTGASALFGNAVGKAYVTGKGIKEVVLEIPPTPATPPSTYVVQPVNGGGLFYEMTIKHF